MPDPDDFLNPFTYLAGAAGKVVADGWTAAMLGLWNAGLWVLRLTLSIVDAFLTPDLAAGGPGAAVYRATFWVAGALAATLAILQLGVAAARRDGRGLARVAVGFAQFAIVWAAWIVYGVTVVTACGGLTRALMQALLRVDSWSAWQPWQPFGVEDITDGTVVTVLGLMGLLLWLAAIGHLLVMLTRAGALLVLAATTPVSAAGLLSDAGRSWFWKSLRWFHAAAFTPVVMVLVLGVGVQMTSGVANGLADGVQAAVGTALPGVVLILIGCFSPLALFKLLAFVDPGTPSGAALRQGLTAAGGLQGLLAGPGDATGPSAAAGTDAHGRSAGEAAGEQETGARFGQAERGLLARAGGAAGSAASTGLGVMQHLGGRATAVGADLTNQMGVGHASYHPDFTALGGSRRGAASGIGPAGETADHPWPDDAPPWDDGGEPLAAGADDPGAGSPDGPADGPAGGGQNTRRPEAPAPPQLPPAPAAGPRPPGGGSSTGTAPVAPPASAPAGAVGGADAAAAVPAVPA